MKRAKKRPLPSRRRYGADDGPLTVEQHVAIKSVVERSHGRVRYKLTDLMAQVPPGTKFEEIDWGPPVGKEIW